MEFQQDFLGRDTADLTVKKMARFTEDQNRDIDMALARMGFPRGFSMFTRFLWIKLCDKINYLPREMRGDAFKEAEKTVDDIVAFIPMYRKQLEAKGYYGQKI